MPAGVVDGVVGTAAAGQDELGDGHEGVALLEQALEDIRQSLRGVEGGVVEEDNGTRAHLGGHPLGDLAGGDFLPVQAVHVPNSFKPLLGDENKAAGALLPILYVGNRDSVPTLDAVSWAVGKGILQGQRLPGRDGRHPHIGVFCIGTLRLRMTETGLLRYAATAPFAARRGIALTWGDLLI